MNGYRETSGGGRHVRLYFLVFHIATVWLTVNILVSTIISSFDLFWSMEMNEDSTNETVRLKARLDVTTYRKHWGFASSVGSLFGGGFDEDEIKVLKEREERHAKELSQTRDLMQHCPIPIFIMTSAGKYTLTNDAYLTLDYACHMGKDDLVDRVDPDVQRNKTRSKTRQKCLSQGEPVMHKEHYVVSGDRLGTLFDMEEYEETLVAWERPTILPSGLPGSLTYLVSMAKSTPHFGPNRKRDTLIELNAEVEVNI